MGMMKRKLMEKTEQSSGERTTPIPAPRNVSYAEYYRRWGYLPPGFSVEIDSVTIHGGCAKWRSHADKMGYPLDPSPWSTKQQQDDYQRFLDKTYRPWLNLDPPIPGDPL